MSLWCSEDSAWLDAADLDVADITMELDETVLGSPAAEPVDFSLLDFEPLPACAVSLDSEAAAAAMPTERVMEITPRRKRKRSISSSERLLVARLSQREQPGQHRRQPSVESLDAD